MIMDSKLKQGFLSLGLLAACLALCSASPALAQQPKWPYAHAFFSTINDRIVYADAYPGSTTADQVNAAAKATPAPCLVIITPGMSGTNGDYTGMTLPSTQDGVEDERGGSVTWGKWNGSSIQPVSTGACTFDSSGNITCAATGTNSNITLTPSGTGLSTITNLADKGGQVFNVKAYGAKGDGVFLYNCSITSGTATLDCPSGNFSVDDVGKLIEVDGAASSGGRLITTITGFTDSTHVTVGTSASTTTTTANVVYGTNDGSAIQDLITALSTTNGGTLYFPKGIYIDNDPPDANGFIIDIPYNTTNTGQWKAYQFEGPTNMGINSPTTGVPIYGAVLYDMSAAVTGFIGASSVGPSYPKSDVYPVITKMAIVIPPTQNYSALHFQLAYDADVSYSFIGPNYGPSASVNVPMWGSSSNYGIYLPTQGNAGIANVMHTSVVGFYYGVLGADHSSVTYSFFQNNKYAIKDNARGYGMFAYGDSIQGSAVGFVLDSGNVAWGSLSFENNSVDLGIDTGTMMGTGFLELANSGGTVRIDTAHMNPGLFYVDGNNGIMTATVQSTPRTFSTVPACSSTTEGQRQAITDSTANTLGATITGGGTDHVLGYCDGTNWTVAAQ